MADAGSKALTKALTRQASFSARVRDRVRLVIERTGYWVVPVGPANRVTSASYTAEELALLDRDLARLGLNDRDYQYFPSPDAVRGYLVPSRINSYHKLLEACRSQGLRFEGKNVMEVGVGCGYLLRLLASEIGDGSLNGCDHYEELARIASGLAPTANIFQANLESLKSWSERYDVVFCCESLEHVLDTETSVPTLLKLVAPGGALVLTVPNCMKDFTPSLGTDDGNTFVGHVNFWSNESWAFYIQRMVSDHRFVTGVSGGRYADESLYAVIFVD